MLLPVALKMQILPLSKSPNSPLLSPDGDTTQRIAAYFSEALGDRILKAWPGLHKALNSIISIRITWVSEEIIVHQWKRKTKRQGLLGIIYFLYFNL
jgi:hypothetical protein